MLHPNISKNTLGVILARFLPVDLYLIFEKSSLKNQVRRTGFLDYFELD